MLENANIYNPLSGVTTNQSEGFNTVLKRYQHWKEVPIDSLVLSLYRLQQYYYNEIQRGYCGLGGYLLRIEFSSLLRPSDELQLQLVTKPEDILPTSTICDSDNATTSEASLQGDTNDDAMDDSKNDGAMDDSECLASDSSQICRAR